jgi:hypothetical protein
MTVGLFSPDPSRHPERHIVVSNAIELGFASGCRATPANCREVGLTASPPDGQYRQRNVAPYPAHILPGFRCQFYVHDGSPGAFEKDWDRAL